jgi:membrane protein
MSANAASSKLPVAAGVVRHDTPGLKNRFRFLIDLFADTAERFSDNEGYRLGAAFSYYATFSIFPLLLLAITVVGFVLGDSAPARDRLLWAIANPGSPVRDVLERSLTALQEGRSARGISAVIGVVTLLFAASGAFVELDAALNRIWGVPVQKTKGIVASLRQFVSERLAGFAIVAGLGLSLLLSLFASSILTAVLDQAQTSLNFVPLWPAIAKASEVTLSVTLLSFVFTMAFHFIPKNRPPIRVVVAGAILTTTFLMALKEVFATYLSHLTSYSAYGVAGGVLALATWIYLSSMIIFFGAQLTRIHAEKMGVVKKPSVAIQSD